jgi:hypothetical protein
MFTFREMGFWGEGDAREMWCLGIRMGKGMGWMLAEVKIKYYAMVRFFHDRIHS